MSRWMTGGWRVCRYVSTIEQPVGPPQDRGDGKRLAAARQLIAQVRARHERHHQELARVVGEDVFDTRQRRVAEL